MGQFAISFALLVYCPIYCAIRSHVGQNLSLPGTTEAVSAELILKGKIRISLILAVFLLNNLVFFGLYIGFYV